ncbi:MAG: NADH-quinone oxidoreductase subunit NuoE [Oscillospiraceae bacterium]|jgi:NADP-reducing hydrogenase subunit HndA|nr:NADH-quinone oxidoreductase subunit NuoE [Oscillospiraceae bacterium]
MSSKACTIASVGTPEQDKKLRESIAALHGGHSLVQILQAAQEIYGYLPEASLEVIASELDISPESVYSVATFYSQFTFSPKGKYAISVCLGTACYVKGAGEIYSKIKEKLGVEDGGCTADGKFSLDACRCMGACGLAPVLSINEDVYGKVTPDQIDGILKKCD